MRIPGGLANKTCSSLLRVASVGVDFWHIGVCIMACMCGADSRFSGPRREPCDAAHNIGAWVVVYGLLSHCWYGVVASAYIVCWLECSTIENLHERSFGRAHNTIFLQYDTVDAVP